ncbi:cell wall metabolism sensor histidine kinase WalK [Chitinophaga sp. XS-30]|uniref:sensor histidine kinase n=1 Tax=Chitinophaga sp. XS-30 TaxID=2604421 RepID=UPI0011DE5655|nr:HAMP domain-containing sensor histidine kinase [Chitinophaga sp. XS-30]QEH41723.1 HAMP domain-containing histidine kinase [Chitinophaga sp. XS-30]
MSFKTIRGNLLFWKISGVFTGLLLLLGIAYVIMASAVSQQYFYEVNQQLYGNIAGHLASTSKPFRDGRPDTLVTHDIIHSIMVINPGVEVYLLDTSGRILDYVVPDKSVHRHSVDLAPVLRYIDEGGRSYISGDNPKVPGERSIFSAAPVHENGRLSGYVYAVLASEQQASVLSTLKTSFFLSLGGNIFIATLVIALLVGIITFFLITNSINRVAATVARFKEGDYTARIEGHGKGNLGLLTTTFNEMADTIVANMEQISATDRLRQELIANVSHDLRTPLAIMQGYIETLLIKQQQLPPEEQTRYLHIIFDSSRNLGRLVEQLFEYSKLEANQIVPQKEPVAIGELVNDILLKYQILAEDKRISLEFAAPEDLPQVFADVALMERVIQNLLDNALKFTAENGSIRIRLINQTDQITISVSDNGSGIPAGKQSLIFERYRQVEGAEADNNKGMGLGLAIVKKILDLHQATIHIRSAPGDGTTFWFSLPAS